MKVLGVGAIVASGMALSACVGSTTDITAIVKTPPTTYIPTTLALTIDEHTPIGPVLATKTGLTIYAFSGDRGTQSACNGACAQVWLPIIGQSARVQTGLNRTLVGDIRRKDGTYQLTYNGYPLYTYVNDTTAGQFNGQGVNAFGGTWGMIISYSGATDTSKLSPNSSTTTTANG